MLDIAVAYNRYRFLGNEFLTWLWFTIENDMERIHECDAELVDLNVGNRMVLENRLANGKEHISIKGDDAGLEEALLALQKGALITDLHLVYKSGSHEWQFALKGESLSFSGMKLPESGPIDTGEEMEGLILEKVYLYEKPFELVDRLFRSFLSVRLADTWQAKTLDAMKKWIHATAAIPP
ncbi:MAG: hypothetical protein HKP58_20465 [Desulfatitalea sp.]|nr:hypothetical protein [Desulfatitalea sp.]NNK02793.1 hypothetical protein [Desulfatitalea sp.]